MELWFDVDYDHAMESVFYGHPENVVPFCAKACRLLDANGKVLAEVTVNHHAQCIHTFASSVDTDRLTVEVSNDCCPAAVFEVRVAGA